MLCFLASSSACGAGSTMAAGTMPVDSKRDKWRLPMIPVPTTATCGTLSTCVLMPAHHRDCVGHAACSGLLNGEINGTGVYAYFAVKTRPVLCINLL